MRRALVVAVSVVLTLLVPAVASAGTVVGSASVQGGGDSNTGGQAEAFKAVASATGTIDTLHAYLDSLNTASAVEIGLYTNSASKPSSKITSCTITSPSTGWNSCSASGSVTSGTTYWTAILRPSSASGTLRFRDNPSGATNSAYTSTSTSLGSLPSTYTSGDGWPNAPASIYGSDSTAPDTLIDSGPANPTTSTSATFTFHATETSTFSCSLDGTPGACTSPAGYSSLATGSHTFSVVATDGAANTDPTPATYSWTIETTGCTTTVSSISAAQSALASASPGDTVCLADGSYGNLSLSATKSSPGVTVRAEHPGQATIDGASLSGSYITIARFVVSGHEVTVQPGSDHMTVDHNRIDGSGGQYFGLDAGPTSDTYVSDVTISGNLFTGEFGEDSIRANRYHDGADADTYGMLVIDNEFTGNRENGEHNDCFQSVWGGDHLYYIGNYVHDNRCQGFFIKDQPDTIDTVVVQQNLMLRNDADCWPTDPTCGQPSIFQLFGPMTNLAVDHNTIWTPGGLSPTTLRDPDWGPVTFDSNVIYRPWSDTTDPFGSGYTSTNNVAGTTPEGDWPSTGFTVVSSPSFSNPSVDDYRTGDGRGVDWQPSDKHFGP
jgi:hypothetical protein